MKGRFVLAALALAACGSREPASDHSHAADAIIQSAPTAKEREELTKVRDDVDAAARERLRQLDAEIARLEKENAQLRR